MWRWGVLTSVNIMAHVIIRLQLIVPTVTIDYFLKRSEPHIVFTAYSTIVEQGTIYVESKRNEINNYVN